MSKEVKHPEVVVQLTGEDGNAFFMVGRTQAALKRSGVSNEECTEFFNEALSGDYDHVLRTIMSWVTVE